MRKVFLAVAVVAAVVWVWTLTDAPQPEPSLAEEQILRRGNGPEPGSLDPHQARLDSAGNILRDLYEGLTTYTPDGRIAPGVAESWTISEDGRVYTFVLREDARWSSGEPLIAEDFVRSFQRLVDPATGSPYALSLEPVENATAITRGELPPDRLGAEAPDERTLILRLIAPTTYLLELLTHWSTLPVHGPSLEALGTDGFVRPGKMVSNGAFVLKDWVVGSHVSVERNSQYWRDEENRIDAVRYYHIGDPASELNRYRAGELDFTYTVPGGQFAWVQEQFGEELHISPQITTYYYGFNLSKPPFRNNRELRQALSMVIDREALTRYVTGRGELAAYGWVPPGVRDYTPQRLAYADQPLAERLEEAQRLYKAAGYSPENPARIELRYNTEAIHRKIAAAISEMWREHLGVETRLIGEEMRVLMENMREREVTQVFRSSWVGDYNDAFTFLQVLESEYGINLTGYSNPEYDDLLARASTELDPQQRRELLQAAERLVLADHALVPIYFYVNKHLVSPRVRGWAENIMNYHDSRYLSLEVR